jgi:hypothetical protein
MITVGYTDNKIAEFKNWEDITDHDNIIKIVLTIN